MLESVQIQDANMSTNPGCALLVDRPHLHIMQASIESDSHVKRFTSASWGACLILLVIRMI